MKIIPVFIWLVLIKAFAFSQQPVAIIPQPNHVQRTTGKFVFSNCTELEADPSLQAAVQPLIDKLNRAAGIDLHTTGSCATRSRIVVHLDGSTGGSEGYNLNVQPFEINLKAATTAGIFYGVQSLLQLLPAAIEKGSVQKNINWEVPCVVIIDSPRFSYRGIMLDVARHFMPVSFLYKLIDLMAMQKMNRLHLHLTDTQGWRFESKKFPKLTQIGAYRKGTALNATYDYDSRPSDTLYGGYYTQQQLREVVDYAALHFITIIPEIEMPAHSESALASYPEFACLDSTGHAFDYPHHIQNEYCIKDETFAFLDTVLAEVMDVFPGKTIHVAGDEASKINWKTCAFCQRRMKEEGLKSVDELQSYFIKRIEKFVNSRGRQIIGWDEILQGGLAPNAAVMSWTGIEGGIAAARQHHVVVMTPGDYCYFDHYQSDAPGEPIAFGGHTTLATVYGYDPVPLLLNKEEADYISGTQGNLWTEYIPTPAKAEYMLFPRSVALAETGWTMPSKKNYEDFIGRLTGYLKRLNSYSVNYSRHLFEIKLKSSVNKAGQVVASLGGITKGRIMHYTLDGKMPTEQSPVYTKSFIIRQSGLVIAAVLYDGEVLDQLRKKFDLHIAVGKRVTLKTPPDKDYNKGGNDAWANGSLGNDEHFSDDEWLGWEGKNFEGTVDLGKPTVSRSLQTRFFHKPSSWIWSAKKITVQTSPDGKHFKTVAEKQITVPEAEGAVSVSLTWPPVTARYIRIIAEPIGTIPAGNTGAGDTAWLFADEMILR